MKNKEIQELKKQLENNITKYVELFCKKHDLYFDYWVADLTGTIVCLSNEYYIDFNDIRHDLEQDIKKKIFKEWYYKSMEEHLKNNNFINFTNYAKITNNTFIQPNTKRNTTGSK